MQPPPLLLLSRHAGGLHGLHAAWGRVTIASPVGTPLASITLGSVKFQHWIGGKVGGHGPYQSNRKLYPWQALVVLQNAAFPWFYDYWLTVKIAESRMK